jgi:hypothetical protein
MPLLKKQREILVGLVLGDAYLQKTGQRNARLRLEHSAKQKEYIFWKWQELQNLMQDRPKRLERFNPVFRKKYAYYRCQSHASPILGKFRRWFYVDGGKIIPENIRTLFKSSLSLAVWYMDDGYYYPRDKSAYIYIPRYPADSMHRLLDTLEANFGLKPRVYKKKKENLCLYFNVAETIKLMDLVKIHIIHSMHYKTPQTP